MRWERQHGIRLTARSRSAISVLPRHRPARQGHRPRAAADPMELGACSSPGERRPMGCSVESRPPPRCGSRRATTRTSTALAERERTGSGRRRASPWTPTASSDASVTAGSRRCPARLRVGALWGIDDRRRTPAARRPSGADPGVERDGPGGTAVRRPALARGPEGSRWRTVAARGSGPDRPPVRHSFGPRGSRHRRRRHPMPPVSGHNRR